VKGITVRKTIVALLLIAPSLALASGYTLPNTNPRDLGVCASAVAAQRDQGAVFALPAALARLRGPYVQVGGGAVNVFSTWTDPTPGATVARVGDPPEPGTADLDLQFTGIPNVAVAYGGTLPFLGDRGWGAGVSLQAFGGAIVKWPDDWAGRYRITEVDRKVFSGIASVGVEVIPQVRVGGGLMYYRTQQTLKLKGWQQPFGGPTAPDATGELELDGGAFTYTASAEITPLASLPLTIAVDYKHKATQDLDGDVTFTGVQPAALATPLAGLYGAKSAKETLTIPNLLNIGVSYRLMKPLLLMATFTLDRWVVYEEDLFVFDTGANFPVARDYGNGQTYRVGAEYDLTPGIQLRAGVQRDESGLKSKTYSPTLPDASSWGVSLGGTFKLARGFSVDAAVFYANMDKVTATETGLEPGAAGGAVVIPAGGSFRGSYEPQALVYTLAVAWAPPAR
jgi:long-chain fatty acid transport protein